MVKTDKCLVISQLLGAHVQVKKSSKILAVENFSQKG